jgi:hypothetical protein
MVYKPLSSPSQPCWMLLFSQSMMSVGFLLCCISDGESVRMVLTHLLKVIESTNLNQLLKIAIQNFRCEEAEVAAITTESRGYINSPTVADVVVHEQLAIVTPLELTAGKISLVLSPNQLLSSLWACGQRRLSMQIR